MLRVNALDGPYCGGSSFGPLYGDDSARRLLILDGEVSLHRLQRRFPAARPHTVWCLGCSRRAEDGASTEGSPSAKENGMKL